MGEEPSIEEIWRVAELIRRAEVRTPNGPRSVGYYISVGLDAVNHPHDRFQELLNAAAEAVLLLTSARSPGSSEGE